MSIKDRVLWESCRRIAKSLTGKPFAWDARPPESYNCLALIKEFYERLNFHVPFDDIFKQVVDFSTLDRDWWNKPGARNYYVEGAELAADRVELSEAYAGDLILTNWEHPTLATHAGIVIDGCQFIHARFPDGVECPRLHGALVEKLAGIYRVRQEYR